MNSEIANLSHNDPSTISQNSTAQADQKKVGKLPYQANHQVELLHLQAETEALLQQLRTLKQNRSSHEVITPQMPEPALALR
ncbi:MAG TPA: hypothetical protein V6D10_15370 [Trichocoleus sp.]